MIPSPSATATALAAASGSTNWQPAATLWAAIIAALLSGISILVTKRSSARDNAMTRFAAALDNIDADKDHRVEFGLSLLRSMCQSRWLSKEDQEHAVNTLRAYNRPKSVPGGEEHEEP